MFDPRTSLLHPNVHCKHNSLTRFESLLPLGLGASVPKWIWASHMIWQSLLLFSSYLFKLACNTKEEADTDGLLNVVKRVTIAVNMEIRWLNTECICAHPLITSTGARFGKCSNSNCAVPNQNPTPISQNLKHNLCKRSGHPSLFRPQVHLHFIKIPFRALFPKATNSWTCRPDSFSNIQPARYLCGNCNHLPMLEVC